MKTATFVCLGAMLLSGCAPFDNAPYKGLTDSFDALIQQVGLSEAIKIQTRKDFDRSSKALKFVSGDFDCESLGTKETDFISTTPTTPRDPRKILLTEAKNLEKRKRNLEILDAYFVMLKGIVKNHETRKEYLKFIQSALKAGAPLAGPYAAAVEPAAGIFSTVATSAEDYAYVQEMRRVALANEKDFEEVAADIAESLKLISEESNIYLKAWEQCQDARFNFIKLGSHNGLQPKSGVFFARSTGAELDSAFYGYRIKYDEYKERIPDLSKLTEKLVAANRALINATDTKITLDSLLAGGQTIKEMIDNYEKASKAIADADKKLASAGK
jgi:hypothetical protein